MAKKSSLTGAIGRFRKQRGLLLAVLREFHINAPAKDLLVARLDLGVPDQPKLRRRCEVASRNSG